METKSSPKKPSMKVVSGFDSAPNHFYVDSAANININAFVGKILFTENTADGKKKPVVSVVMTMNEMLNLASQIFSLAANDDFKSQLSKQYEKVVSSMPVADDEL